MDKKYRVPLNIAVTIEIPMVPNFLRLSGGETMLPVSAFTEKELRAVGAVWTEKLIERTLDQKDDSTPR